MRYIGIDLAWGTRNTTAAVALTGSRNGVSYHAHDDVLTDNEAIADFVQTYGGGGGLLIAVDAPTLVPNAVGQRPCEALLSHALRKQEAGAHPANRTLLADASGVVRGEALVALLEARFGVTHTPYLEGDAPRAVFEVFPHPAHIALFGLDKTLKYKRKPGRDRAFRNAEFARYAALLSALSLAVPALTLPDDWLVDAESFITEVALKRYEDRLDALTCAYVAAYHHRWQGDKSVVIGDRVNGHIVTPASETLREWLAANV
ncbi:MAG: DUF429 domain-containing protein [Armatimonadetes bacterium]|nr:DUF429 domain-containing protein [Armatimonadota bacterium]